jgi:hypothetical protein
MLLPICGLGTTELDRNVRASYSNSWRKTRQNQEISGYGGKRANCFALRLNSAANYNTFT